MLRQVVRLVFAGHIDHGKSTLIGRLLFDSGSLKPEKVEEVIEKSRELGKDIEYSFVLDSFQEEREGGITIDIVRTPFNSEKYEYQIIDCPGHKEFVKNMVSGASQADAAVLLVSAKEGVEEQTRRHAFLLNFLGIRQVFVAVNKMDLVNYSKERFEGLKNDLEDFMIPLGFEKNNIVFIPISAKEGDNVFKKSEKISWYEKTLLETLDENVSLRKNPASNFRMPIQDVMNIDDVDYALGTIISGSVSVGDYIVISPQGVPVMVERIRNFNGETSTAETGESVALKFKDFDVDDSLLSQVAYGGLGLNVSSDIISQVIIFPGNKLNSGDKIILRLGAGSVPSVVRRILKKIDTCAGDVIEGDISSMSSDEAGIVLLSTDRRIAFEKFTVLDSLGRTVILKDNKTIGAGVIL